MIRFNLVITRLNLEYLEPGEDGKTFYPFGPNFWLYRGQDINNIESCYSEIDIFEIIDGEMNTYTCNSHNSPLGSDSCGGYPFYTDDGSYYGGGFGKQDISGNTWHFSSVHWTPEKVDYYLDRKLIKTNYKQWAENLDPMQIILDINAPKGGKDAIMLLDNPIIQYPYRYDIDYVRIYQPISNCGTIDKTYCTSTYPSTLDGATVQKSITFGGTGCSASYPDIINSFYANDYILINENTTLGGGSTSELFLEVHSCY
ncbi:MAG: glycoside hydrolase family 16 protein [Sphingobacteriales bacterium JAD_PAG50586_3]|nr:MAG: glycoside hydrolase family 16 protein [Sphingobacteriales bacterium JAD_PAG50586_3]